MSLYKSLKAEVSNNSETKRNSTSKRDTSINVEALTELKGRLSILGGKNDNQPPVKPDNNNPIIEVVQCLESDDINRPVLEQVYTCSRTGLEHQKSTNRPVLEQVYNTTPSRSCSRPVLEHDPSKTPSEKTELTSTQMAVYSYLLDRGISGLFNQRDIAKHTGIPYNTVRNTVRRLQVLGFIFVDSYSNITKQLHYRISNTKRPVLGHVLDLLYNTTHKGHVLEHDLPIISSSSSFLYLKTTTAKFFEHPESEFWKDQSVTSEMFEKNIQEHGFDPEVLIMSAKHYAFEYSQPGKTPPEKSHLIHLIGGIRKFGLWTKPNGYVSYEDAEKRRLEAFIANKRKELEELEALKLEASFFMFYEAYVKTPDSEEVKAVMDQASSFDLDNLRKKPDKKEAWLRTIWNKSRNMN